MLVWSSRVAMWDIDGTFGVQGELVPNRDGWLWPTGSHVSCPGEAAGSSPMTVLTSWHQISQFLKGSQKLRLLCDNYGVFTVDFFFFFFLLCVGYTKHLQDLNFFLWPLCCKFFILAASSLWSLSTSSVQYGFLLLFQMPCVLAGLDSPFSRLRRPIPGLRLSSSSRSPSHGAPLLSSACPVRPSGGPRCQSLSPHSAPWAHHSDPSWLKTSHANVLSSQICCLHFQGKD